MAMPLELAVEAIAQGLCLSLAYQGHARIVEVHACGLSTAGHEAMRVWQVEGGSRSGRPSGWRMMRLDEVEEAFLTDIPSLAPRPGYARDDKGMARLDAQV